MHELPKNIAIIMDGNRRWAEKETYLFTLAIKKDIQFKKNYNGVYEFRY